MLNGTPEEVPTARIEEVSATAVVDDRIGGSSSLKEVPTALAVEDQRVA